ncbi:MAG: DUF1640 domain-containing protein [Nitrospinae bacterium]|nr:DUF1640 domain-containing protein [Nitrospinota bacterium]
MPYADTLKVFSRLREGGFEEGQAKVIAQAMEEALESNNEVLLDKIATKEDLATLRAEFKQDLAALRAEVRIEIANLRADLIKWMFLFWIGQGAVVFGIVRFLR